MFLRRGTLSSHVIEVREAEQLEAFRRSQFESFLVVAREGDESRAIAVSCNTRYTRITNENYTPYLLSSAVTSPTFNDVILLDLRAVVVVEVVSAHALHFRRRVLRVYLLERLRLGLLHLQNTATESRNQHALLGFTTHSNEAFASNLQLGSDLQLAFPRSGTRLATLEEGEGWQRLAETTRGSEGVRE